ncbi:glycoside hydrolase family 32 protein [Novosphingobium sp.]|uniref:glycoside hydrolase family 32 protein n=1 Tax=Novosphingobium sp. TaxID=1874826 RepID=UPI00286E4296|nr:glycoside hydrolase family 32 protein [Novosphingobium sp.]
MRPRYHYAPASNWLSDPNGLVHHDGEWHLFYQYNPQGEDWGHMSWGHAVSRDLAHWEELPVALRDDARHMIFSGSAVIDVANTAGFGANAMVALYTGAMTGEPPRQVQCIAASTDAGRTFAAYPGNPVLDLGLADFRDPNVFWHDASQRWIMVVALSADNSALIYGSANLKDWDRLSAISGAGAPGEVWECPLLIELPVAGGGTRWLFKVDVLQGGPGSGAIYLTGSFDGESFQPDGEGWKVADWGADFYAAIAWHEPRDAQGRPLWIGWMGNHAYQGRLPAKGWRGAMSLPRRIGLRKTAAGHVLCQEVVAEAAADLPELREYSGAVPIASHARMEGEDWRIVLEDGNGRAIDLMRQGGVLRARRMDESNPFLDAIRDVPLASHAPVELWLDAGSIEVMADDGAVSLTLQHCFSGETIDCRVEV